MVLLGIGSAKINLILPKETYKAGEHIYGYYLIKGGTIDQQLKRVDCELIKTDQSKVERIFDAPTILTSKIIRSKELYKIPFSFKLPTAIPGSSEKISYRFNTKLTFSEGAESKDVDEIN